jgi:putative nucleotidyltransferase with HDIG domain
MSFGVAELQNGGAATVKELIDQADQALYMAKHLGRNRACLFTVETNDCYPTLPLAASEQTESCAGCNGERKTDCVSVAAEEQFAGLSAGGTSVGGSSATVTPATVTPATVTPVPAKGLTAESAAQKGWALGALVCAMAVMNALLLSVFAEWVGHPDWVGIASLAFLAAASEIANVEIYAKQTSVSTSAAALLGGSLLFGPAGVLVVGASIAIAAGLKYRSPLVRICFNANNHMLGGFLCVAILAAWGEPLSTQPVLVQVALTITCAVVLYLSSTALLSLAISLSTGQRGIAIWAEKFRWLWIHYVALGFVAYGLVASYPTVGPIGIVVIILPLAVVRYGQKQYIAMTEAMVNKLQQANQDLVGQKQAVEQLNGEMLTLLAAALDLRDPSVQSHCEQVAAYATAIAAEFDLSKSRIEQVRRAALLHDIGKLAVPDSVLYKAAPLNHDEYAAILQHPVMGAQLLERFSSLHALADFVRHHHEHFDGSGYPDGLRGDQIPLEARIIGLADAVEAMASERPYQPALPLAAIRSELRRCCGTQFDPQVVGVFLSILDRRGDEFLVDSARHKRCWQSAPLRTMQPCMPAVTN